MACKGCEQRRAAIKAWWNDLWWRSMDTAPTDGRTITLRLDGGHVVKAFWQPGRSTSKPFDHWEREDGQPVAGKITHWQP